MGPLASDSIRRTFRAVPPNTGTAPTQPETNLAAEEREAPRPLNLDALVSLFLGFGNDEERAEAKTLTTNRKGSPALTVQVKC